MTTEAGPPGLDLVFFSSVDWGYTWQRPQQLASRLAGHGRVLYVDPLGLRSARLSDVRRLGARAATRVSIPRGRRPPEGLTLSSAPLAYLPFPASRVAARLNGRLLARAVSRWMARFRVASPVVWVGTPSAAVLRAAKTLPARLSVYDCLDRFALFHGGAGAIAQAEQEIVRHVDLVLTASRELHDSMKLQSSRTFLVPNGADYEHFSRAGGGLPCPELLARVPRPIVGYFGEIAHWFDVEAVSLLASSRPQWSIVLIGPLHTPAARPLVERSNVHWLGRRPYDELPQYLSQFDVCLLPFVAGPLTSATNPVKLYEYLAAGKPVVSTPLPEVLPYRDVVNVATPEALAQAVEVSLGDAGNHEAAESRRAVARANTWDHRVKQVLEILHGADDRP